MKIHHLSIIIVVMALAVLGMTNFITELGINYNQTYETDTIYEIHGELEGLTNTSGELRDDITSFVSEEDDVSDYSLPYKFLKVGINMVKVLFGSITTAATIIAIMGKALTGLDVPYAAEVIAAILTALLFTLAAIVVFALIKWKVED